MTTYSQLLTRARKMGHELTPTLRAELKILASIPDDEFRKATRKAVVEVIANDFQVPVAVAERRIEGIGPYRGKSK